MSYFLELQAEGIPRHVGPFRNRAEAAAWAYGQVKTGSWSVVPMVRP